MTDKPDRDSADSFARLMWVLAVSYALWNGFWYVARFGWLRKGRREEK